MYLLRTLGSPALFDTSPTGDRQVPLPAKRLALLVFLARGGRGTLVRRDVPLALLWPDLDQAHARGALRQALSAVRRQLGPHLLVTRGDEEVGLSPDALRCDATEFENACAAGDHATADARYQGDFLSGFHAADAAPEFQDWVEQERVRLRRLAIAAAWGAAVAAEAGGRGTEAAAWARRGVSLAPEDEAGAARLIALLDRQGDRSGAIQTYEELERRLAETYGVEPAPETRKLLAQVRARRAVRPGEPTSSLLPVVGLPPEAPALPAEPVRHVSRSIAPSRRLSLGVGLVIILTLALVATSAWNRRGLPPQPDLLAIMPFRVTAADSTLGFLHEGMVELLALRLTDEGGLRVADPGRLLSEWRRRVPPGRADLPEDQEWQVARMIGAGRIIHGSVTGTPERVSLSAWVLEPDGRIAARAGIDGSPDSLPSLVDRLAAQLLGLGAGIEAHRMLPVAGASLPALRAFLAGRTAFRTGRVEAAQRLFHAAVDLDTSFALAGLELYRASRWLGAEGGAAGALGRRRALAGRARLSAADQALLEVMGEQWISAPVMFGKWERVTASYPDRPESWYGLGDAYYHWGGLAGMEGFLGRAEEAFRRGWVLDSIAGERSTFALAPHLVAEPMSHMVELAQIRHDTAEVRRLVRRVLAADSTSELASTLRWHLALLDGDSARRAYWSSGTQPLRTMVAITLFISWTGVGVEDFPRVVAENRRRGKLDDSGFWDFATTTGALNGGRPSEIAGGTEITGSLSGEELRGRLRQALFWGGDSLAAVEAARRLEQGIEQPADSPRRVRAAYQDICALGEWRTAQGDLRAGEAASRRLRTAFLPHLTGADSSSFFQSVKLCSALIDATRASALRAQSAEPEIATADSLARIYIFEVCCGEAVSDANLILARLWERAGNPARALEAIRRRAGGFRLGPQYLSSFLREEGRLNALAGDTVAAVRAYRSYLGLRFDPEPVARPEVDRVRRELALLTRRPDR